MKSLRRLLHSTLLLGLPIVAQVSAAPGIISISLDDSHSGRAAMLATDAAGVSGVRVTNWNNVRMTSGSVTALGTNLVYSDGTSVGGTFSAAFNLRSTSIAPSTTETNDARLFQGFSQLGNFGTDPVTAGNLTLTGIPFASYAIYVYVTGQQTNRGGSISLGDETFYIRGGTTPSSDGSGYLLATSTTYDAAALASVSGGNYVLFDGLSGASQTISLEALFMGDSTNLRFNIAGIQIVDTSIPEPSQAGLFFGLLMLAVFGLRRRR